MSIITVAEYLELIEEYPELDTVCLDEVALELSRERNDQLLNVKQTDEW